MKLWRLRLLLQKLHDLLFGPSPRFSGEDVARLECLLKVLGTLRTKNHIQDFARIHELGLACDWTHRNARRTLARQHESIMANGGQRERLRAREMKMYSQNGEDGIILYLLDRIGVSDRRFVNIGGGGTSNTTFLLVDFGWSGVEVDADEDALAKTRSCDGCADGDVLRRVESLNEWITVDNVNQVLEAAGITNPIDLFTIDIDGNDYWVWEAMTVVQPRLVVAEYNAFLGPTRSAVVTYDPEFDRWAKHPSGWYCGASLTAMTRLADRKGYALVGCESNGVNAFFVRRDLLPDGLDEMVPQEAYYPHFQSWRLSEEDKHSLLEDMDYVTV